MTAIDHGQRKSVGPSATDRIGGWLAPRRAFVILALLLGLPLTIVTAPFQAPDEPQHFLRAYQISEGRIFPQHQMNHGGGVLPISLTQVPAMFSSIRFHKHLRTSWAAVRSAARAPLEPGRTTFTPFVTSIYSPAAYVPQSVAIAIGRHFVLPPLVLMYLGRIANLLTWIALGFLALCLTPIGERAFLLLLLMPMSLFQAASLSADATTNGLAILLAAMVLRQLPELADDQVPRPAIGPILWAGFALVSAMLTLTKFAYFPIAAMVLLIPSARFGGRRRQAWALAALILVNTAGLAWWLPQTHGLNVVLHDQAHVSPRRQVAYLLSHPQALITVPARTFLRDIWRIFRSFIGWLGSMDTPLWGPLAPLYAAALVCACWLVRRPALPSMRRLAMVLLIPVLLCVAAVALLNYVYWTPVGARAIDGMQGRYFIPLAPAIVIFLLGLLRGLPPSPWSGWPREKLNASVAAIAAVTGAYALAAVYLRYYGLPHG